MIKDLSQTVFQFQQKIKIATKTLDILEANIENSGLRNKISELQEKINNENLWNDAQYAAKILKELHDKEEIFKKISKCTQELSALKELVEAFSESGFTEEDLTAIESDVDKVTRDINKEYMQILFDSEEDDLPCFIEIKAGVGGTEAQDWAQMLFNMYQKFGSNKYYVEIADYNSKDVGIDSATLKISGPKRSFPYGYLRGETGTHRLVRPSPFNKNNKRHTSFVEIFVGPIKDREINIEILEKDLRIDTYRASGAGGQHVNRTDSAVRITHLPTGVVAQSQNDRSQHKNKAEAMKMLKLKLYAIEEKKKKMSLERKGLGGWGQQIRSYILDDSTVIDHRTNFTSHQPKNILEGDLEPFLWAYTSHCMQNRLVIKGN